MPLKQGAARPIAVMIEIPAHGVRKRQKIREMESECESMKRDVHAAPPPDTGSEIPRPSTPSTLQSCCIYDSSISGTNHAPRRPTETAVTFPAHVGVAGSRTNTILQHTINLTVVGLEELPQRDLSRTVSGKTGGQVRGAGPHTCAKAAEHQRRCCTHIAEERSDGITLRHGLVLQQRPRSELPETHIVR